MRWKTITAVLVMAVTVSAPQNSIDLSGDWLVQLQQVTDYTL